MDWYGLEDNRTIKEEYMNNAQTEHGPFKACTICDTTWQTRSDFLGDPEIFIVGYQVHFDALVEGIFLFNHSCGGTLSINTVEFTDLYKGSVFQKRLTGGEECPGFCLYEEELGPCPAECECAFVREIIQIIKEWKKTESSTKGTKKI
jgi:hypothetical protein